jgi:hypothetical protein
MNTSVDVLMAPYGEADGGGSCFMDFGNALPKRWRETKKQYCSPTENKNNNNNNNNKLNSRINCYLVHQTRHHGNGDNICVMENVALDLSLYNDEPFTRKVIEEYVNTRHAKQPYPKFPKGFLQADCQPESEYWRSDYMPGWNADITTGAFKQLSEDQNDANAICSEWVDDRTVILAERDTFANFFHDSEDFVNTFLMLSVLQLKPKEIQMYLLDLYPEGPFWEMWSEVYSHYHPAFTAWNIREKFHSNRPLAVKPNPNYKPPPEMNDKKNKKYTCFKSAVVGIYGPAAPITVASWDTPCRRTALVCSYSDFVIRSLHLQSFSHYALPKPSRTITITYMSRRPSKEWPERKYCNDTDSFFKCRYWENFGPRQLGRMVSNDQEVMAAMKRLEDSSSLSSMALPSDVKIKFQAVDFNILSFKEQIKVDLETDILIGPRK